MTKLAGGVELEPLDLDAYLHGMAAALVPLHAFEGWRGRTGFHAYFPYTPVDKLVVPGWTADARPWRQLIEILATPAPPFEPVFLHRDYHPGNVLWEGGRVTGVIDWPNACYGPADFDVAYCAGNLAALFGVDAAERFIARYERLTGRNVHAYWLLAAISDHMPEPGHEERLPTGSQWVNLGGPRIAAETLMERGEAYLRYVLARYGAVVGA
jgi:hypothetical protein